MPTETTTLADVCRAATEEGAWINGDLDLVVKRGEPPQGNKPSKASVYDPGTGQEARLVWFGGDLREHEGKVIRVGGKGNKGKLYRGNVEINVGKNGTLTAVGAAPAAPLNDKTNAAGNDRRPGPTDARAKVDPTTYFHRELSKTGLLWAHAYQYAQNVEEKVVGAGNSLPEGIFQSLVSSIFITAKDRGLYDRVPALREVGSDDVPLKYVPPAPDPAAIEAEQQRKAAAAEAERKAKEAEELARKAREHPQENLDEDVPF